MIALEALPAEARQAFQALQAENARLARINQLQAEQIRLLNLRLWGPKGEKFSTAQSLWLLEEASVTAQEIAQEAATPAAPTESPLPKAKPARRAHPGREKLPAPAFTLHFPFGENQLEIRSSVFLNFAAARKPLPIGL